MANDQTLNPMLLARISPSDPHPKADLLPAAQLVYGLIPQGDDPARAYSLATLRRAGEPVQAKIGDVPIVLMTQYEYQVGAYVRRVGETEIELKLVSKEPLIMEDQLGNQWNAWGRKVSGPDYQAELPVADGYLTKWYEWLENFPDTDLVADRLP